MLPHDMKNYRAPRWYDAIADLAPAILLALAILAITLDRLGWGA